MGENAIKSSTGRNGLLCSSLFSLCWCLLSILALILVGPQLSQSRLTLLQIRYCPMALPAKLPVGHLVLITWPCQVKECESRPTSC